jgi:demethylmacrocin O-methyltransferase
MNKLTQLGIKSKTDKSTYHKFTDFYYDFFKTYSSPRILEIGVFNFSSISMYLEYFDNPYIVGMDIDDKNHYANGKWKFIKGDQTNIEDLKKCVENEELFDIIIDDGGHYMDQQQISFGFLIDYVKPGGYYILEDLHTSFRPEYINNGCEFTSYEMLELIKQNHIPFSNYIDYNQQKNIINRIDNIQIWCKNPNDLTDSVTSILKIK